MALDKDRLYQILLKSGKQISTCHQVAEYVILASHLYFSAIWPLQVPGPHVTRVIITFGKKDP